ncbi:excisionase family DNA binding protein [Azospirillum brasilense]|uniref:Excisionase family DNA binding protein n=1 Tax=Azospirillum brasilense TaxID=192 RepID=A0A560CJT9_AZOBR|nr:DNA-binding protein [Azospirillum brasilense]TWA85155.1 excisionase family DNA binding protein [Azospirillum brasilense]
MKCRFSSEKVAESVEEFCASVGIKRTSFYKNVAEGRIKVLKAGRRTLVPITERDAFLRRLAGENA